MTGNAPNILAMVRRFHPSAKGYTLANYVRGQIREALQVDNYLNGVISLEAVEALENALTILDRECKK